MPSDKKKLDSEEESDEIILNNSLPTVFVDGIGIRPREDRCTLIRFITNLPEGQSEQGRFVVLNEDLRGFIDAICEAIEYYPKLPSKKTPKRKVKKKDS